MDTSLSKPGDGEGQGSLARCSPWGCKESDATKRLNSNNNLLSQASLCPHFKDWKVRGWSDQVRIWTQATGLSVSQPIHKPSRLIAGVSDLQNELEQMLALQPWPFKASSWMNGRLSPGSPRAPGSQPPAPQQVPPHLAPLPSLPRSRQGPHPLRTVCFAECFRWLECGCLLYFSRRWQTACPPHHRPTPGAVWKQTLQAEQKPSSWTACLPASFIQSKSRHYLDKIPFNSSSIWDSSGLAPIRLEPPATSPTLTENICSSDGAGHTGAKSTLVWGGGGWGMGGY